MLELSPKAKWFCTAQFEEGHNKEDAEGRGTFANWQEGHDGIKYKLEEMKEAPLEVRIELTAVTRKLKGLRLRAKKVAEELSLARANVVL